MKTKTEKELDAILWQTDVVSQLERLKSQSEISEKLQEIVDERVNELVNECKKELIEKAAEWFEKNVDDYVEPQEYWLHMEELVEDFRKAMLNENT